MGRVQLMLHSDTKRVTTAPRIHYARLQKSLFLKMAYCPIKLHRAWLLDIDDLRIDTNIHDSKACQGEVVFGSAVIDW